MQPESLQRVENDLAVVRAALGDGLPFDRSHVAMHFMAAGGGLLLVALTLAGLEAPAIRNALLGYGALIALAWAVQIRHLRARRADAPSLWRWGRKEVVGSLVAMALLIGYVVYAATLARLNGAWDQSAQSAMNSSIFYFLGTFGFAWIAANRRHWPGLGWATGLLAAGVLLPWCRDAGQFYLVMGGAVLLGGLGSGTLLWWQVRRHEVAHAD